MTRDIQDYGTHLLFHIQIILILKECVEELITSISHCKESCLCSEKFLMDSFTCLFNFQSLVHNVVSFIISSHFWQHETYYVHFMHDQPRREENLIFLCKRFTHLSSFFFLSFAEYVNSDILFCCKKHCKLDKDKL